MPPEYRRVVVGLLTPSFLVAAVLLGAAAVLAGPFAGWMRFKQNKEELPLEKPLAALDSKAIAPYRVVERFIIDPAEVEALGTTRYLNWMLEDTSAAPNDPLRNAFLFVTYYSGGNDVVPHTPDVCYRGGGYRPAQPHRNIDLAVTGLAPGSEAIPARVCTFAKTAIFDRAHVSVVYTFYCNGRFVAGRSGVRLLVNTLSNTYAYFSKVEVSFPGATRAQTIDGARKLFSRVLPVLINDHWPDFDAAERRVRQRVHVGFRPGWDRLTKPTVRAA